MKHLKEYMSSMKNFEEFEGEIIRYSDYFADPDNIDYSKYISEKLNKELNTDGYHFDDEPSSGNTTSPKNAWTVDDSQMLSEQMVGVRHPWSRRDYEKFTHPDVKKTVSYDDYISMWNMRNENNPYRYTDQVKHNWGKMGLGTSGNPGYSTCRPIAVCSMVPVINDYDESEIEKAKRRVGLTNDNRYNRLTPSRNVKKVEDTPSSSWWSGINMGTRVMIILMIIGVFFSFITMVVLMLK
jgi:hypothetical protein